MEVKYKNKKIAEVTHDKIYKKVRKSKHLLYVLNAWGCDYNLINDNPNDKIVHIYDRDEDMNYYTTVGEYKNKGKVMDLKHGLQIFLPLHYWETDEKRIRTENASTEPSIARLF